MEILLILSILKLYIDMKITKQANKDKSIANMS